MVILDNCEVPKKNLLGDLGQVSYIVELCLHKVSLLVRSSVGGCLVKYSCLSGKDHGKY